MRVSVGDCRLYVDVEGPGLVPDGPAMRERPTLVALHGGPAEIGPDLCTLQVVPDCGHAVWRDRPDVGLPAIRAFLAS
jgi:pimeloyl-ACP methyl ester carboxylesterase